MEAVTGNPYYKNTEFEIESDFKPAGDQPEAIKSLLQGIKDQENDQVLLGVTGSGKTFTIANIIKETQRPCLMLAPNKTLAAQLYGEMKEFFPNNAVEYFVSYYDYYQPEAYVPRTDTFIEKDASINEQIDRMRHSATRNLLERKDAIVVASVSCIYGMGEVETYQEMSFPLKVGDIIDRSQLLEKLVEIQYKRNDIDFSRGSFRVRGDTVEVFPAHLEDAAWRISLFGDEIDSIVEFDPLTGNKTFKYDEVRLYAKSHYVTAKPTIMQAIKQIKIDLKTRLAEFYAENKLLEAQRLEERTRFDIEMMMATGICAGIENYSRYLTGRPNGAAPPTLFEYLPKDALLIVDESHVMIPQLRGMYKGDRSRKENLSNYGFRLPACLDNRPLMFEEWDKLRPQTIFVSATPGDWELEQTDGEFIEQIIRPTGLIDPEVIIRPVKDQVDDLMSEVKKNVEIKERVLVTTLTKKMAESLTEYFDENNIKARYMHSDIDTLERIEIIRDFRLGTFDVLIGINLLREGLDIPECSLVAILDADKEGFLRSHRSLIQTIGRAARNIRGRAILYADKMTDSINKAISETSRRREIQSLYNAENGITPKTIIKNVSDILEGLNKNPKSKRPRNTKSIAEIQKEIKSLTVEMKTAAANLEFETAAELRDKIRELENIELGII